MNGLIAYNLVLLCMIVEIFSYMFMFATYEVGSGRVVATVISVLLTIAPFVFCYYFNCNMLGGLLAPGIAIPVALMWNSVSVRS